MDKKDGSREGPAQKCGPCLWGKSRVEEEERGEEYFDSRKREKVVHVYTENELSSVK